MFMAQFLTSVAVPPHGPVFPLAGLLLLTIVL
jgi:hypothetical protein